MKDNLEVKLLETYPNLYKDMYGPMEKTCMHWGITCGDGWFDIVNKLSEKLENLIDKYLESDPNCVNPPRAAQMKEKFGLLRVYMENGTKEMYDLIHEAENESGTICEHCGKPGKMYSDGWMLTLCNECIEKRKTMRKG